VKQLPQDKRNLLLQARTEPANDDDDDVAADVTQISSGKRVSEVISDPSANTHVFDACLATSAAPTYFFPNAIRRIDPECSNTAEDGSGSSPHAPSGQPSATNGVRNKTVEQNKAQKSPGGENRKRSRRPDDNDDDDGDGDRSGGGGQEKTAQGRKQKKEYKRWACPYCLAYPNILWITRFGSCRPPGFMQERSSWK
jgi:hypothetical protein